MYRSRLLQQKMSGKASDNHFLSTFLILPCKVEIKLKTGKISHFLEIFAKPCLYLSVLNKAKGGPRVKNQISFNFRNSYLQNQGIITFYRMKISLGTLQIYFKGRKSRGQKLSRFGEFFGRSRKFIPAKSQFSGRSRKFIP